MRVWHRRITDNFMTASNKINSTRNNLAYSFGSAPAGSSETLLGYTAEQAVGEVAASLKMEGLPVSDELISLLRLCAAGKESSEEILAGILSEA